MVKQIGYGIVVWTVPYVTAVALIVVSVAAGFVPALQASRTDPMVVLRTD